MAKNALETSLQKNKIKFLLLEGVHESALTTLKKAGYSNIEYLKTSLSEEELIEKLRIPISLAFAPVTTD